MLVQGVFGLLASVDVRAGAEPFHDGARIVLLRHGHQGMPAKDAIETPQPAIDLVHRTGLQAFGPVGLAQRQVIGMDHGDPGIAQEPIGLGTRVVQRALADVVQPAIRMRGPQLVGRAIRDQLQARLAHLQRLRDRIALCQLFAKRTLQARHADGQLMQLTGALGVRQRRRLIEPFRRHVVHMSGQGQHRQSDTAPHEREDEDGEQHHLHANHGNGAQDGRPHLFMQGGGVQAQAQLADLHAALRRHERKALHLVGRRGLRALLDIAGMQVGRGDLDTLQGGKPIELRQHLLRRSLVEIPHGFGQLQPEQGPDRLDLLLLTRSLLPMGDPDIDHAHRDRQQQRVDHHQDEQLP